MHSSTPRLCSTGIPAAAGQRATVGAPHLQWPSLDSAQLLCFVKFKLQFNFETEPSDTSTSSFLESDASLEPQRDLQREYWNWSPLIHPSTSYKLHQDTVQYYTHNTQHSTLYMIHTPGTSVIFQSSDANVRIQTPGPPVTVMTMLLVFIRIC